MSRVKEKKVIPVREHLLCDCGEEMAYTGRVLCTSPPQYPHYCEACGYTENVWGHAYPRITYKDEVWT